MGPIQQIIETKLTKAFTPIFIEGNKKKKSFLISQVFFFYFISPLFSFSFFSLFNLE